VSAPASKTVTIFYGIVNGFNNYLNLTRVIGHEILEAMTDADNPPGSGWFSGPPNPLELCDGALEAQTGTYTSAGGNLFVQAYWSNKHGRGVIPGLDDASIGASTAFKKDQNGNKGPGTLQNMKVFLIFWSKPAVDSAGTDWIDRVSAPTMHDLTGSIQALMLGTFSSQYFSQVGQYGVNPPTWGGACVNTITPVVSAYTDQHARNVVVDSINAGLIPPPNGLASGTNPGTNYFYFVIAPFGVNDTQFNNATQTGVNGHHGWIKSQKVTPSLAPNPTPTPTGVFYNVPDPQTAAVHLFAGGTTRFGEISHASGSKLGNQTINQVTVYMKKVGAPTGNVSCRVRYNDDTIVSGCDTSIAASSITTSVAPYNFTFTAPLFNFPDEGVKVLIEYYSGDASNYIAVEEYPSDIIDGASSCSVYSKAADSTANITTQTVDITRDLVGSIYSTGFTPAPTPPPPTQPPGSPPPPTTPPTTPPPVVGPSYRIYYAWIATKNTTAGTATDPQVYASREMINLITNPELTGYKSGTNQLTTACLTSMGAGNYTDYTQISNTWASPFYSNANGSCILPNLNEPTLTPTNLFTKAAGGKVLPVVLLEQIFWGKVWPQQFNTANPPYPLGTLDDITQGLSNLKYFTDYYSKLSQYGIQDVELDAILWNPSTALPITFTDQDIVKCLSDIFNPNLLTSTSSSFDPTQSVTLDPSDFPVSSPTKATFCYLIFVDNTASHSSGQTSGHGFFDWTAAPIGLPECGPAPPGTPPPAPGPSPIGGVDANGVQKIYPGISGTEWYMDMTKAKPTDDNSFYFDGMNSGVTTNKTAAAGALPTFYNTTCSNISYASGSPNGKTLRVGVYAGGGKNQTQLHTWKEKPDFIYDSAGIRNHEWTIYVRPQSSLSSSIHHSCAAKVCGGKQDAGRSLIETVYPISSTDKVRANYNYEHFPYVAVSGITQYFSGDWFQQNVWVGLKHVHKVNAAKTQSINELWVDTTPFKSDGTASNTWKLKASWTDKGTSGYNNIPCTWKAQVDKWRFDGFNSIDYTWMSDREIDPNAGPASISGVDSAADCTPAPIPPPGPPAPGPPGPTPGGAQVDQFGLTKIYPDGPGSSWVMSGNTTTVSSISEDSIPGDAANNDPSGLAASNPNDDPRTLKGSLNPKWTQNSDGSWKDKQSEARWDIAQNNGFNESSLVLNQATLATRGYMQDPMDWGANGKGIEATAYFRINATSSSTANGESHFEFVAGGARQTSETTSLNGFPRSCEAYSYHANYYPNTGRTKFEKDLNHTSGYAGSGDPNVTDAARKMPHGQWFGWKAVKYLQADGKSVKLESYIDVKGNNNWVKAMEFVDHGQWGPTRGKIGGKCGGGEFTVCVAGGPIYGMRWDNITDIDCKWASIRSINPLGQFTQATTGSPPPAPITTPTPSNIPPVPTEGPAEGPATPMNLPQGSPQTTTPSRDLFGVKNLYPSAQTGEQWYMSHTGLFGDHQVLGIPKGQAEIRNSDGSFHLQTPKAMFYLTVYVATSAGFNFTNAGGTTGDQSSWATRGYMMDARDWTNVEITFFHRMRRGINTDGGQDAGAGFIARGGQEQVGPPNCQGCGYRCAAVVDARLVTGFDKEQWYNQYAYPSQLGPTYSQMNVNSPVDRWVGRKFVLYNIPNEAGDDVAVKLEHWWNDSGDGVSWVKVQEYTDSGGWGGFAGTCNANPDQVISWGGPLVGFHWKNLEGLDYKFLSIREIDPSGQIQTTVGGTTPGPGPAGPTDVNPAPKPPLNLPLIGSSIFNLSKQAYGVVFDETGGCDIGVLPGQQGATEFYTSPSSNTPVQLWLGSNTRFGEHAATSSILIGKIITEVDVWMKAVGSPTGTITVTIRKGSDDSIAATMGTMAATSLTGTMKLYTFTNTGNAYTIVATDKVLVEFGAGNSTNYVAVDESAASTMDGVLSYSEYFSTGSSTTPYSQTTDTNHQHMAGDSTSTDYKRLGEKVVNSSSVLFGKIIGQVDVYGARSNTSVTGTVSCNIRKGSDDSIAFAFPTHNVTDWCQSGSICASPVSFIDNSNTYALAVGDRVSVEYSGGTSSNYFRVAETNTDTIDGGNTIEFFYHTSYSDQSGRDWMAVIKTTSGAGVYTTNTAKDLEGNMWSGQAGGGGGGGGAASEIYSVVNNGTAQFLDSDASNWQRVGVLANNASSILVGQIITQVDAYLGKFGTPTGNATVVGRKGSDDSIFTTYGTIDVSTLTVEPTFTLHSFTNNANTWVMVSGDRILIEYAGGDTNNGIDVAENTSDVIDGSNTCSVRFHTTYSTSTGHDWSGNLWSGGTGGGGGGGTLVKIMDVAKVTNGPIFIDSDSADHSRGAEKVVNTSSKLYNKIIKQVDIWLSRVGSPTGTGQLVIRDANDNIKVTIGTIDVSTVFSSNNDMHEYTFSNTNNTYATKSGDRISFEYTNGNSSNYLRMGRDTSNPFDGSNSVISTGMSWSDTSSTDICATMWV
jgi:hypothetical protein